MVLALGFAVAGAGAAERVALVVGNAAYEHTTPLANPGNDAADMAAKLRGLGFEVLAARDVGREGLFDRVAEFADRSRGASVSLFYYAGHGLQVEGSNYLVPVDARLERKLDVRARTVELSDVLGSMGGEIRLVFLDACRNNPLAEPLARSMGLTRSAAATRGLASVRKAPETLIVYATGPDEVAADGEGRNSPFTAALLEHLDAPGVSINDVLTRVKRSVGERTGDRQRPWTLDSLTSVFEFVPGVAEPVAGPEGVALDRIASDHWEQIKNTRDPRRLTDFIRLYRSSSYGSVAEARLEFLAEERWRELQASNDADALERFPHEYPGSPHVSEALARAERLRSGPVPGERFRDALSSGGEGPQMVVVPAGSFMMGSPPGEEGRDEDEGPVHRVTIGRPFAVGVYEVTRAEYGRFVDAVGRATGGSCFTFGEDGWQDLSGYGWRNPGFEQTDAHPVACVSWDDAKAYAGWLSRETGETYRLLSEAEWEYAARAGSTTRYHFGNAEAELCVWGNGADLAAKDRYGWNNANNCRDGYVHTAPVGSLVANGFGLHDMHGNLREWVEDCWNGGYAGAPGDGGAWRSGDCAKRVLRGGSWGDNPGFLRSANRIGFTSGLRYFTLGFRVARTLIP